MSEEDERVHDRIRMRLSVVDGLLWATENAHDLVGIGRRSPTGEDAIRVLTGPPYEFSDFVAQHILDVPFRRLSEENLRLLREEKDRLRHGEDTGIEWRP